MRALAILALLASFCPLGALSPQPKDQNRLAGSPGHQGQALGRSVLPAVRIQGDEPVIDGLMSEEVWA
ncbi:MAG: hypothetical protein HKO65_02655, partial [Gemmatimonadetes bacterium]|nr:hypothetical protein [Gemmatimonadota bacterium]